MSRANHGLASMAALHSLFHFFHRHIFLVRGYGPNMTEWISEGAGTIAVKLILHGALLFAAGSDRLFENSIDVVNIKHQTDGRAAPRRWAFIAHFRMLIREHDRRVANLEFRMPNLSTGHWHAK